MPDDEETRCEVIPLRVEVTLKGTLDAMEAALRALGPTSGGYTDSPMERDKHPFEGVLRAWGWHSEIYVRQDGTWVYLRGLYGDWSWFEDDEKLMPALAPFVVNTGEIIFQDPDDARYNNGYGIQAWVFKDGVVTLHTVEQEIEYFVVPLAPSP